LRAGRAEWRELREKDACTTFNGKSGVPSKVSSGK
jgi:hypothetical protein